MYSAINGTGDTSVFDFEAITFTFWDRGGYDVIDFSNETAAQAVDLRAEAISSVGGKSNNMLIARGTVIEDSAPGRAMTPCRATAPTTS
ncbi:M10 family metallopeptidase C-terminal domain-containing protein [Seohaeicola zhoushanensis]